MDISSSYRAQDKLLNTKEMEETSAFDLLVEYPQKHGLEFDTHRDYKRFYLVPNDPLLNTKFVVFKAGTMYFYAYDSYAVKAFTTKTYTGLYSATSMLGNVELKVYKKDFIDTFLRTNKRKTRCKYVDDFLTITSTSKELPLFLSKEAVSLFLEMNERFPPFHLIIEKDYLFNINELKDKKVIGLETQQWLYKEADIDRFLKLGEELIENIQNTKIK